MAKSGKGSDFEREISKLLSMWWTRGERDDVFWRTAQSGGRATERQKKGQSTAYSYGDITATDPIGMPLIQNVTIELKRGYHESTVGNLLDKKDSAAQQPFEAFLEQTVSSARDAATPWWWLISKRDRKEAMISMPVALARTLFKLHPRLKRLKPRTSFSVDVKRQDFKKPKIGLSFVTFRLHAFLETVPPDYFQSTNR